MIQIIYEKISIFNKFDLDPDEKDKSQPICNGHQKYIKNLLVDISLLLKKSAVQNLFEKKFLKLLKLSLIKYKVSIINHISILH